jgi:hypothetical protein
MASLQQYQQQWGGYYMAQMQPPPQDLQDLQVLGAPSTSRRAPPLPLSQKRIAASHDWAYQAWRRLLGSTITCILKVDCHFFANRLSG